MIKLSTVSRFGGTLVAVLILAKVSAGYSVLTHEAIIDSEWEKGIKPALLKRYRATPAQLREARAYAYGGAIIQDMGYYPLGSKFFTDLVHYVRSGDFIENLLKESSNIDEYAFALGALAHYASDNAGHSIGVNRAVPVLYPKLRKEYGTEVTYEDNPDAHIKTEFGFDVVQVAGGRYLPQSYHDFIGFKVARPVLERAFHKTYGLEMKDLFVNLDLAIATYRKAVSSVIPEMTQVAWETKKDEIEKLVPGVTREKFVFSLSREDYEKEWGSEYDKPGFAEKMEAHLLRIIPKIGPFKGLSFKPPTPEAEQMFHSSLRETLKRYHLLLASVRGRKLDLKNVNFDTGHPTRAGDYELADAAYSELLDKLAENDFANVTPELRRNILGFYANLNRPISTKKSDHKWRETLIALERLKATRDLPRRPASN
jgi:hypothetical protein